MPHNGPRGSPVTERRNDVVPAANTAVVTMLPAGTLTTTSLTRNVMSSRTGSSLRRHSRRQVRLDWNRRRTVQDLIDEQFRRAERGGDPQSLMTRGQVDTSVFFLWSNQRQLVWRPRAKSRPRTQRGKFSESG